MQLMFEDYSKLTILTSPLIMKNFKYILLIVICFGCDPEICNEEIIKNRTNRDLEICFYNLGEKSFETTKIMKNSSVTFGTRNCNLGGSVLNLELRFDSIILKQNNTQLKIWKPQTPGKNIYDIDTFWILNENPRNNFVYSFEITEEDLE